MCKGECHVSLSSLSLYKNVALVRYSRSTNIRFICHLCTEFYLLRKEARERKVKRRMETGKRKQRKCYPTYMLAFYACKLKAAYIIVNISITHWG